MDPKIQNQLQSYLGQKNISSLFVNIMEELLVSKPHNPIAFIIHYLSVNYPVQAKEALLLLRENEENEESEENEEKKENRDSNTGCMDNIPGNKLGNTSGNGENRQKLEKSTTAPVTANNKRSENSSSNSSSDHAQNFDSDEALPVPPAAISVNMISPALPSESRKALGEVFQESMWSRSGNTSNNKSKLRGKNVKESQHGKKNDDEENEESVSEEDNSELEDSSDDDDDDDDDDDAGDDADGDASSGDENGTATEKGEKKRKGSSMVKPTGLGSMEQARRDSTASRRNSVSAAPIDANMAAHTKHPVYDKTVEEFAQLREWLRDGSRNWVTASLGEEELTTVIKAMSKTEFAQNQIIVTQGDDQADHYFVLAHASRDGQHGNESTAEIRENGTPIRQCGPGDGFGEMALLYNSTRCATVRATSSPCVAWQLDRETLKSIVVGAAMRRRSKYAGFLENVPLLKQMNERERLVLADALQPEFVKVGEVILKQGDENAEMFYILVNGQVRVQQNGKDIEVLHSGTYFGEIALLTSQPRQATIIAHEAGDPDEAGDALEGASPSDGKFVEVAKINRRAFHRIFEPLKDTMKSAIPHYKRVDAV